MRVAYVVILMAACSESGSSVHDPTFAGEILRNGGFEALGTDGFATDWVNVDTNAGGEIGVVDDARFGAHALQWRIDAGDGFEYFILQNGIPGSALAPGTTYQLTGSVRTDDDGDIPFMLAVRGEQTGEPSFDNNPDPQLHPAPDTWTDFTLQFTVPVDATPPATWQVVVDVVKFTGRPLTLTIDGLSLHPKL